jgi:hypothetical protein
LALGESATRRETVKGEVHIFSWDFAFLLFSFVFCFALIDLRYPRALLRVYSYVICNIVFITAITSSASISSHSLLYPVRGRELSR